MANYYGKIRTNYFKVMDKEKFNEIMGRTIGEFDVWENDGKVAFGGDEIYGIMQNDANEDDDYDDVEVLYTELQKVIAPDDAILIFEAGYEKLRYLVGCVTVITQTEIRYDDITNIGVRMAKEMLNNSNYDTRYSY